MFEMRIVNAYTVNKFEENNLTTYELPCLRTHAYINCFILELSPVNLAVFTSLLLLSFALRA